MSVWTYAMCANMHTYIFQCMYRHTHTHNVKRDKEITVTITRLANQVGLLTIPLTLEIKKREDFLKDLFLQLIHLLVFENRHVS